MGNIATIFTAISNVLTPIFGQKRDSNNVKWNDRLAKVHLDLLNELAKGEGEDESKIEALQREFGVVMAAATIEAQALAAKAAAGQ